MSRGWKEDGGLAVALIFVLCAWGVVGAWDYADEQIAECAAQDQYWDAARKRCTDDPPQHRTPDHLKRR